ncbi:MAG: hypothetical protein H0W42_12315 [Gemmatimonadaceae bacterium]|nr:hypothetical protein [Gemmatimonadaceae bacterium]
MSHPAKFSAPILDLAFSVLRSEWEGWMGRPHLFDPFAGTGQALHEACTTGDDTFAYSGCEIEASFIEAPGIFHGDATDPAVYPPARGSTPWGWCILTSPPYGNGISDHAVANDASKRFTYRKAIATIEGVDRELADNNLGRHGFRGTQRGGKSVKRAAYWDLARRSVVHWKTAEMVILNVSDFISGGEVEPHVNDWRDVLYHYGWGNQVVHPVGTQRIGFGENHEARVAHEVVVVARRD